MADINPINNGPGVLPTRQFLPSQPNLNPGPSGLPTDKIDFAKPEVESNASLLKLQIAQQGKAVEVPGTPPKMGSSFDELIDYALSHAVPSYPGFASYNLDSLHTGLMHEKMMIVDDNPFITTDSTLSPFLHRKTMVVDGEEVHFNPTLHQKAMNLDVFPLISIDNAHGYSDHDWACDFGEISSLSKPIPSQLRVQPEKPPAAPVSVKDLVSKGLAVGGASFSREGLQLTECKESPEARLLADKEAVQEAGGLVLDSLVRNGSQNTRQLVRTTGLPEDVLNELLYHPYPDSKDHQDSLLNTHRGVVVKEHGKFSITSPEALKDKQMEVVGQVQDYVQEALDRQSQVKHALELAQPFLPADMAPLLDTGSGAKTKDLEGLFQSLKSLGQAQGDSAEEWLKSWSANPEDASYYWQQTACALADQVTAPLQKVHGYEQLTHKMSDTALSFDFDAVDRLSDDLHKAFGPIAYYDAGVMSNALYICDLTHGQGKPNVGRSAPEVAVALGECMRQQDSAQTCKQAVADLEASVDKDFQKHSQLQDPRLPSPVEAAAEQAAQESQLSTPQAWASYLDEKLPVKALARLQEMEPKQALQVLDALPLTGLSPNVAEPCRRFMQATLTGDKAAKKEAARDMLTLIHVPGEVGASELGDKLSAGRDVRLASVSWSQPEKYIDKLYHRERSKDGETIKDLLGVSDDTLTQSAPLSQIVRNHVLSTEHDNLFRDMVVARLVGDDQELAALQKEATGLCAEISAATYSKAFNAEDARGVNWNGPNGPMSACAELDYHQQTAASDLGVAAARAKTWCRMHDKTLPLSEEDAKAAAADISPFWNAQPQDGVGINWGRLAELALDRVKTIPPEELNQILA